VEVLLNRLVTQNALCEISRAISPRDITVKRLLLVFSLINLGCVNEDARPLSEYLADYQRLSGGTLDADMDMDSDASDDTNPDLPDSPDLAEDPCSTPSQDAVTVTLINGTSQDAALVWIDFECTPNYIQNIPPAGSVVQNTFVGHVFELQAPPGEAISRLRIQDDTSPLTFEVLP
jgi:hypothetical protein